MITLQDIPKSYAYCFAGADVCPKAETCLRAIAARIISEGKVLTPFLRTVNPVYVQQLTDKSACGHYRPNEPLRFAVGMTHLFDDVPLKKAHSVRLQVIGCFSSEATFYRARKGEQLIPPHQQDAIRNVFLRAGIHTEPRFDEYRNAMNW